MTKKKLFYIICAMSIALLGFISVQIYWTRQVFRLQEQVFKNTVNQAMDEVIFQINRRDIAERVLRYRQHTELIRRIDTLNSRMALLRQTYPSIAFEERSFSQTSQDNFVLTDPPLGPDTLSVTVRTQTSATHILRLQRTYRDLEQERALLLLNSRLFDDLLRETMRHTPEQHLLGRLDPYEVDSLIARELNAKDLHTGFEWGIFSKDLSKLIVRRSRDYGVRLLQSPYYYPLFPNDPSPDAYFLIVDFPQQKAFIASRMWYRSQAQV